MLIASRASGGFNRLVLFGKITLVGVGLLGGSLALAIRARKLAQTVQGYVRRDASISECALAGLVDFATRDLLVAVRGADLVILCTPLSQMRKLTEAMLPALKKGVLVTDVGSVKGSVIAELEPIVSRAGAHFIGSHPMAGGEKSGVGAASARLFSDTLCILTPTKDANPGAVQLLEEFWHLIGARVLKLTPGLHDELVARCSHLPHVIAAELANYVLDAAHPKEQPLLCANGFRDTTRIASGSPAMWRDIALANREQLGRALDVFVEDLKKLQRALENNDTSEVETFFVTAKQRRDAWSAQGTSSSSE
ncbi:MAG TPA: prephenate dehydrogenase/arogenate dehydrogenase family protein [Verrucomicrobiae bacterium]